MKFVTMDELAALFDGNVYDQIGVLFEEILFVHYIYFDYKAILTIHDAAEYAKNWNLDDITVFHCESKNNIILCLIVLSSWDKIQVIVKRTLKMKAFL